MADEIVALASDTAAALVLVSGAQVTPQHEDDTWCTAVPYADRAAS